MERHLRAAFWVCWKPAFFDARLLMMEFQNAPQTDAAGDAEERRTGCMSGQKTEGEEAKPGEQKDGPAFF